MNYPISALAKIIDAEISGNINFTVNKLFFDTRSIISPENGVFIAIKGLHDGHLYMEEAYEKAVRIFICSHIPVKHEDAVYLIVNNTMEALQKWASYHIKQFHIPIIGITGSNGKTIVKEWLYQCIWEKYNIVRSPKSFNSQLGLPISVLQITSENNLGIFEAGISQPGEMVKLENILQPEIGILTNILSAHSEFFKNREDHISEKIKLFKNSKVIIFNNDHEDVEKQIRQNYPDKKLISFGEKVADICLINKQRTDSGTELEISIFGNKELFYIPFSDEASIQNILCLTALMHELNLPADFMREKFKDLQTVSMRMELVKGINDNVIINDTFNSDLKSLEISLNFLIQQNKEEKAAIISDILESRIPEKELYSQIAGLVNTFSLDTLFLIGDNLTKYRDLFKAKNEAFNTVDEVIEHLDTQPIKNTAILIKGARKFELEKVALHLEAQTHDTVMEINLFSLIHNVNYFRSLLKPKTKLITMVKASSYGTGNFEIAETLQHHHIDYLAVAIADEGTQLREKGIYLPIIVMNPEISSYDMVIDKNLEPEIYSFRLLEKFIKKLKDKSISEKYPVHIKLDTGMTRLGFQVDEIERLGLLLKDNPFVKVESVFSHFAVSDVLSEKDFTIGQAEKLKEAYGKFTSIINYRPMLHICNTAGIVNYPEYHFDAVRLGIGMYGYVESEEVLKKLETVVTLKTVISNLHSIQKDTTVGYGRRFKAERDSVIATLPIGYADGIRRLCGNGIGYVLLNGKKAPIVGSICMDMMMIDVTDIPCQESDPVIILGNKPTLQELSEWCQTIPYEILTSIAPRVKRIYYKD